MSIIVIFLYLAVFWFFLYIYVKMNNAINLEDNTKLIKQLNENIRYFKQSKEIRFIWRFLIIVFTYFIKYNVIIIDYIEKTIKRIIMLIFFNKNKD